MDADEAALPTAPFSFATPATCSTLTVWQSLGLAVRALGVSARFWSTDLHETETQIDDAS